MNENRKFLLGALFALVFLNSATLLAEKESYRSVEVSLSWSDVPGNQGYLLQIQSADGAPVREIEVQTPTAKIELPPGEYQVRLAALNKFHRPSVWSPWKEFQISGMSKTQSIAAEEEPPAPPGPFDSRNFVPGLKRISTGLSTGGLQHHLIGGAWIAGNAGSLLYFVSQRDAGTAIARDPLNDPLLLSVALYGADIRLMALASIRRGAQRDEYIRNQNNQKVALELFALFYLANYFDSLFLDDSRAPLGTTGRRSLEVTAALFPDFDRIENGLAPLGAQFHFTYRY